MSPVLRGKAKKPEMKNKASDPSYTTGELNDVTKAIPFLLAGFEGHVAEFDILGLSLQRLPDGAFRSILRGVSRDGPTDAVRLVAFTNAGLASECLCLLEVGFRENLLRWHIDRYASNHGTDGATEAKRKRLTLTK